MSVVGRKQLAESPSQGSALFPETTVRGTDGPRLTGRALALDKGAHRAMDVTLVLISGSLCPPLRRELWLVLPYLLLLGL